MARDINNTLEGDLWEDGFLASAPYFAFPCLIFMGISALAGTFGNFVLVISILTDKTLHTPDSVFVTNLATSDMYVTLVWIPFSIIAKVEGEDFFRRIPGLCQTIASLCTVSCVTSLMTIGLMSINRYVYICVHDKYERIFSKFNCICMCVSLYLFGGSFVLLNFANIGDHGFDRKSLECIWDRMATYSYTVVFSITLVWIPSLISGVCYLKIYIFVRKHCRRVNDEVKSGTNKVLSNLNLAKTLFILYAVFLVCWGPYSITILLDTNDNFSKELHLFISMLAHLHPSFNWIVCYTTNKKFAEAYRRLLRRCPTRRRNTAVFHLESPRRNVNIPENSEL